MGGKPDMVVMVDEPEFDFDELSWGDSKRAVTLQLEIQGINQRQAELAKVKVAELAEADRLVHETAELEANEAMFALLEDVQALLAGALVSVPRSWLVRRAPVEINWYEADSLDYLKQARFKDLMTAFVAGQSKEKKG